MQSADGDHPTLRVSNLCKTYRSAAGAQDVLRGVTFEAAPGDTLAVVGASGCGKSTLLNIIGSLDTPSAGSVTLGDVDVVALRGDALARYRNRRVGFVFQDHHLLPQCTVRENVVLPALAAGAVTADQSARAAALLERVGLAGREDDFPHVLSGGERQRVAIARALVNDPPLVLCDEPTGNLDRDTGESVGRLFIDLARQRGAILVIVTHNLDLAGHCSRRMQLRDGLLRPTGAD